MKSVTLGFAGQVPGDNSGLKPMADEDIEGDMTTMEVYEVCHAMLLIVFRRQ